MSSRAMILLQSLVGFGDDAIAIFGELLADDDVERELLELADAGDPAMAGAQQLARSQEGIDGRAQQVRWRASAFRRERDEAIIFAAVEPDRAVLVGDGQTEPPSREAGGVSETGPGYSAIAVVE